MSDDLHGSRVYKMLSLVSVFGPGGNRIWETVRRTGSLDASYDALFSGSSRGIFTPEEARSAERVHEEQIKGIISYCESHNIGILCYDSKGYPEKLRNIFSPPVLLFYRGDAEILNDDMIIAVVGSRHISEYTERVTNKIAGYIASKGITVASGFAVGTDIAAHLAAVRNGGRTIAVLGCGLDYDYPEPNIRYREEILKNGVFISEYFPLTAAKPINFIARNRILSGISLGTAVMEASDKSGSLNTASYAASQGKDIWAVSPADIFDSRYYGNRQLLYDGAVPIYSPDDIIKAYFENFRHNPFSEKAYDSVVLDDDSVYDLSRGAEKPENETEAGKKSLPEEKKEPESEIFYPEPELTGLDKLVYDTIKKAGRPLSADDIADSLGLDISDVFTAVTALEIEGAVKSESGQTFSA